MVEKVKSEKVHALVTGDAWLVHTTKVHVVLGLDASGTRKKKLDKSGKSNMMKIKPG